MSSLDVARCLAACGVTTALYLLARKVHQRSGNHPLANTVVLTAVVVYALLGVTRTPLAPYRAATLPLALLLGPTTVAFAVPLFHRLDDLRRVLVPALLAIGLGSAAAAASAVGTAYALGASPLTLRSLAPKSVTTPIAMAVSSSIGGSPELTSVFVVFTGAFGALVVPSFFVLLRIKDRRARGLAIGVSAHGFGTARALALGRVEGAFAILGMGLSGLFVPILIPLVASLLR